MGQWHGMLVQGHGGDSSDLAAAAASSQMEVTRAGQNAKDSPSDSAEASHQQFNPLNSQWKHPQGANSLLERSTKGCRGVARALP